MKMFLFKCCVLFASLSILSACETAEGFGRDIENAGQSIQKAVD